MKKLLLASVIISCTTAMAEPVTVEVKAVAHSYQTHPGAMFSSTGNYYVNVWNNSDIPQPISIVYLHCVDGGGCVQGEDTHMVEPRALWSHEYSLVMTNCKYGVGLYNDRSEIDLRVDNTGQHYRHGDYQQIRSS